jgi:hypothetical protein
MCVQPSPNLQWNKEIYMNNGTATTFCSCIKFLGHTKLMLSS